MVPQLHRGAAVEEHKGLGIQDCLWRPDLFQQAGQFFNQRQDIRGVFFGVLRPAISKRRPAADGLRSSVR